MKAILGAIFLPFLVNVSGQDLDSTKGGGLIRDVLAGRQNLLMSKDLYAIPVLVGCVLYAFILSFLPEFNIPGAIFCILLIFTIRIVAIEKHLTVPSWLLSGNEK